MSSSPRASVLSERDPNVPQSPEKNKDSLKGDFKQQDAPKSLEYHRQALEARLKESKSVNTITSPTTEKKTTSQPNAAIKSTETASFGSSNASSITSRHDQVVRKANTVRALSRNQQNYVSPSDNIMSPATAKLAAFKNRHVKRYGKIYSCMKW